MGKLWFDIGEHVVCRLRTKKSDVAVDLDALPVITIYDPDKTVIVSAVVMARFEKGNYEYSLDSAALASGKYRAMVKAYSDGRYTIMSGAFRLNEV